MDKIKKTHLKKFTPLTWFSLGLGYLLRFYFSFWGFKSFPENQSPSSSA